MFQGKYCFSPPHHANRVCLLRLGYNFIGDAGCAAIADALKHNAALKVLYLQRNRIGCAGAAALALALCENHALTFVDVHENAIGDDGAEALAAALRLDACALRVLYLQQNPRIGQDGTDQLRCDIRVSEIVHHAHSR